MDWHQRTVFVSSSVNKVQVERGYEEGKVLILTFYKTKSKDIDHSKLG